MTVTFPIIRFGEKESDYKKSGAVITILHGGQQTGTALDDISNNVLDLLPYATFEPNFWLLNGNYKFKPLSTIHVGWMSTAMSGSDGVFSGSVPSLRIVLNAACSISEFAFHFSELSGDYANDITVRLYDSSNTLISTNDYAPTSTVFVISGAITDLKKIEIDINATNNPYRYARVTAIDLGEIVTFTGAEIRAAKLSEKINPISVELPINALDFSLYSASGDFSIVEPAGIFEKLQNGASVDVYESVDSIKTHMGRFYIEKWESESENVATFNALDLIGKLDTEFRDMLVQYILNGELSIYFLMNYAINQALGTDFPREIPTELGSINAFGWLEGGISYREYLTRLAFVGGAYITCSRSRGIQIKMMESPNNIIETKVDELDPSITWVGSWDDFLPPAAYLGTLRAMLTSGTYPDSYFTFTFTGIGFILGIALAATGHHDFARFYVSIDGAEPIKVEYAAELPAVYTEWKSSQLSKGSHTVVVYGWCFGDEADGNAAVAFDYITTLDSVVLEEYDYTLTRAEKGIRSPVEQRPLVTGVEVTAHNYIYDGLGLVKIYQADLPIGTHFITFDKPYYDYSVTGGAAGDNGTDWINVTVITAGTVTIQAKAYLDSKTVYSVYNQSLPAGTPENIIRITDVSLVTPSNGEEIATRIYNYYQQRFIQKTKLFASPVAVGDSVLIDTQSSKQIAGFVEKMTTDLSGGMVENIEITGIVI